MSKMLKKIKCWLFGHKWEMFYAPVSGGDASVLGLKQFIDSQGVKVVSYYCERCGKVKIKKVTI